MFLLIRRLLLTLLLAPALCLGAVESRAGKGAERISLNDHLGLPLCFTAETEVHVRPQSVKGEDAQWGRTERKAIKDLRPGDEVLALAEWKEPGQAKSKEGKRLDQRLSYEKVVDIVTSTRPDTALVHLRLQGGQTLTATEGHPFKTPEGWRDAILLRKGGQLLLKGNGDEPPDAVAGSGHAERIAVIEDIRIEKRTVPVFNLEVANAHTFFVGADGALVHNASWSTARKNYWKGCGYADGKPPTRTVRVRDKKTGQERDQFERMELHHKNPRRDNGSNDPDNLEPVWPGDHAKRDPYRHVSYDYL